jgi:hypothetical protein
VAVLYANLSSVCITSAIDMVDGQGGWMIESALLAS